MKSTSTGTSPEDAATNEDDAVSKTSAQSGAVNATGSSVGPLPTASFATAVPAAPAAMVAESSHSTASTTDAARTSMPVPVASAPASNAAPQQMTLRVSPPDDGSTIDIRVAQRAGQMQVTVHTADPTLQANLRQDLPELVQSLDRAGFSAETFVQRGVAVASTPGSAFNQGAFGQGTSDQSLADPGAGNRSADSHAPGNGSPGNGLGGSKESPFAGQQFSGQQSSGQNARDRQTQRWLEQIEE